MPDATARGDIFALKDSQWMHLKYILCKLGTIGKIQQHDINKVPFFYWLKKQTDHIN